MSHIKNPLHAVGSLRLPRCEALLRDCLDLSAIPTFFLSSGDELVYANGAFGDLLGYDPAQCIGLDISAIVHPDDVNLARAQAASVVPGTRAANQAETKYLRQNGEVVWVQASVSRLRGRSGHPPYRIVQAVDIDRQKRLQTAVESRLDFALESVGLGFWDRDIKNNRDVFSPAWKLMRGLDIADPAQVSFDGWLSRVHPDDQSRVLSEIHESVSGKRTASTIEYRELHSDGHWLRIAARWKTIEWGPDGLPQRTIGIDTDITDLKNSEEKLQFANTLLRTEMDASPDGILVVDANGKIISYNKRFGNMWKVPNEVFEAKDDAPVFITASSALKNPEEFVARVRYLYAHQDEAGHDELELKDGRSIDRHTEVLLSPTGVYLGRVWFFRDITERKRTEAQILRMARYDSLTGLANRPMFMEAVESATANVKRGGKTFGVLYLDVNHFKDVNDTLGHPVGDELLKAVGSRLQTSTREGDLVARFGGDEFAVLISDVSEPADAAAVAEALIAAMRTPFMIQGYDVRSSVSIGIVLFGSDEPSAETMLSRADIALYRAKSEGTAGYRFHTVEMDNEIRNRVMLSSELRAGIELGELFMVYQPQVEIATGRVIGMESLVRWRHPARGVLGPGIFIPIAEKSGLIGSLGRWVIREACRQGKAWLDAGIGPEVVAINLSGLQFKRAFELERDIAAILEETGMPANRLEFELTESVLMTASTEHNEVLGRLRKNGVKLAIDDFGVGYSSLDYLRRFPVDRIKIAGDFVAKITTETGSAAIVKATIGLARELGIRVIAEGIETLGQLELLGRWGCLEAQGYYFAKPLAAEHLTPLLTSGQVRVRPASSCGPALPVDLAVSRLGKTALRGYRPPAIF